MAEKEQTEGMDIAELVYDITQESGLLCEVMGSVFDYLLREKKVIFSDLVCAVSYARDEWDV